VSAAGGVLLLSRSEVAARISLSECVAAVEAALIAQAEGRVLKTAAASVPSEGGGFHVKAGGFPSPLARFVAKVNSNFSGNPERFGLPAIQGVLLLADAIRGSPLALMDSIEITIQRTGAATAVAAKRLARPDSRVATICGCGAQGRIQAAALAYVLPIERFFLCDSDPRRAEALAEDVRRTLGIPAVAREDLRSAVSQSDVCVTCTPSRAPILFPGDVSPGTFLAAVGADSPDKQELHPEILARSKVVVDHIDQCAEFGELHHALAGGHLRRENVHGDLAGVVSGRIPGRERRDETIVFDSTGIALEDAAAAALVYERALAAGAGTRWNPTA
jgi:alanine dehydrogenase